MFRTLSASSGMSPRMRGFLNCGFDYTRQCAEEIGHSERFADMRPLGVFARQGICAIAGQKQEGHIPLGESVRDRIDPFAGQIYIEHRNVTVVMMRSVKCFRKSRDRTH